jgi:hypothetical protein
LKVDRDRRTLAVKFPAGPTTYMLAFDADPTPAHELVGTGSDGTKPQVFGLVPWSDRAR